MSGIPQAAADSLYHECGPPVVGYGGLRYSQFLRPGEACVSCGFDPGFPIPDVEACARRLIDLLGYSDALVWCSLLIRHLEGDR